MHSFIARDYQILAHKLIIENFRKKETLLVMMPTGTGKTATMISFFKRYTHYNFLLIVRQRDLVFQFAAAVEKFGLVHSIFMSGEPESIYATIQVCSVDTIHERSYIPHFHSNKDLVVFIDEADETVSDKYGPIIERLKSRPRTFIAGFTATAFDKPLTHFTKVVVPITNDGARDIGALIDFEYICPRIMDLETVRITKGEFNNKDVETKFNTPEMVAQNFNDWLRFGENRQTLVFCNSKEHANRFMNYANDYYGKSIAAVITADISKDERQKIYQAFKMGHIRFIINIRIVTRGVDIPEIGCILDLALTGSENMHIQKLGRGSRPNGIYRNCLIIDVANNCFIHGPFYEWPREINLREKKKKLKGIPSCMHMCLTCYRASAKHPNSRKCPYCGTPYIIVEEKLSKAEKKRQELAHMSVDQIKQIKMINDFKKMLWKRTHLKSQYSPNIDKPITNAHNDLIKKYGIAEVRKVAKSIGLNLGK